MISIDWEIDYSFVNTPLLKFSCFKGTTLFELAVSLYTLSFF